MKISTNWCDIGKITEMSMWSLSQINQCESILLVLLDYFVSLQINVQFYFYSFFFYPTEALKWLIGTIFVIVIKQCFACMTLVIETILAFSRLQWKFWKWSLKLQPNQLFQQNNNKIRLMRCSRIMAILRDKNK